MTHTLTIPPRFFKDCEECACDVGEFIGRKGGSIIVQCNTAQLAELADHAKHYADAAMAPSDLIASPSANAATSPSRPVAT